MKWVEKILVAVAVAVVTIIVVAMIGIIGAIPIYFLWNWLMPEIFGLKEITFLQAWGLLFLSWILFNNNLTSSKSSRSDNSQRKQETPVND